MLISLILATKNRVKEVERFLQSLAAQSYKNLELIIVDQNLDDRLLELVNLYGQQFSILHIKNQNLALHAPEIKGYCMFKEKLLVSQTMIAFIRQNF